MVGKNQSRVVFENIGGSFQYRARRPEDLRKVLELDPTVWAALCVPVSSLNGDPAFFNALDGDGNGAVRVDEVKGAIRWLLDILSDIRVLNDPAATLPVTALNASQPDGALLANFVQQHDAELTNENHFIDLAKVRAKLAAVTAGPLRGNGILSEAAVSASEGAELYGELVKLFGCTNGLADAQLEKFLTDARSFLEWSRTAEKPLFRNDDPVKYYDAFKNIAPKIDEYFRFCDLLRVDPANAARFRLDPARLPDLNLQDGNAVDAVLRNAPLKNPSEKCVLDFAQDINPFYQGAIEQFCMVFNISTLEPSSWQAMKNDFSSYLAYLKKAQGDLAGSLGRDKLAAYLAGPQPAALRSLFMQDKALGSVVEALRKLERLLLYKKYMLEFVNNFVSFEAFFDPTRNSMLQAGRLVMDGRSYNLAVWIDDIAAHRKIAVRSNLCLLYLEVTASGPVPRVRKLAVAVTGGSLMRIYVGKPAFFIDNSGVTYHGKIVDLVEGPISFGQTVLAPFRRISDAMSSRIQKLTDFSNTEKQLTQAIEKGQMPPAAATTTPTGKNWLGNGSVMLLAGGLSVAALSAAASFVVKSFASAMATLSALPGYVILLWIAILLAVFLVPSAIFAFLKMRKRNLTVFLEAGGWAVNLPMRLNMYVSGIFTRNGEYPPHLRFLIVKPPRRTAAWIRRILLFVLPALLVIGLGLLAVWYLRRAGLDAR